jgi:hypothetical protein
MKTRLVAVLGVLALVVPSGYAAAFRAAATSLPEAATPHSLSAPAVAGPQPKANPAVIGLALSGIGAGLEPPTSPTDKPYSANCHTLIDPGFSGKCVVAVAPAGTVAGIVEQETAVLRQGPAAPSAGKKGATVTGGPGAQERDLVWRREGNAWALALVHVSQNPGLPSLVWADDVERDHDPKLVFVTPSDRAGFGTELDLVEGTGDVTLYRFLGGGFADVAAAGGLVTYVPGWTEQHGPEDAYDQTLIGYSNGSWRVFSEQYVPDAAALRQHRGPFWDSEAVAAR